jgi:hypothetical protein
VTADVLAAVRCAPGEATFVPRAELPEETFEVVLCEVRAAV